ncbi:MAG: FtsX-like permease family protein, partial [Spirochaeta sp.]
YTGIMMMLLGIIAIVGISNTMLMSVLERQKEIGMLRSMGMRNREIRSIFMFEAGGIGIIGAAGGLLLGSGLVWLLTNHGIDYGAILEDVDLSAFRFEGVLYGVWDFGSMVTVALFAIVVAAVVAMLPTRRILKKSITECLRQS